MTQPAQPKMKLDRVDLGHFQWWPLPFLPHVQMRSNGYPVILCGLISGHYPQEKIQAATSLVQEQLEAGHLVESNSPLEYPNFCYKKEVRKEASAARC